MEPDPNAELRSSGSWLDDETGKIVYSVRKSRRAKRVLLNITPSDGLIVTIPERFAYKHVPEIIEERSEWIREASGRLADERARYLERIHQPILPETIEFRALGERRWVIYHHDQTSRPTVQEEGPYRLVVTGKDNELATQHELRRWLIERARDELSPWLHQLAATRSLRVTGISIRNQKTRWASCSADGRISLNYNLLFLPRRLVRLVLIHELCHLIELSHSKRFWALLETEEPDLTALSDELDGSWGLVPRWSHE
ncbi:MAG TPA: SprT family zinc-dependent metalloprotease [Acidimicrobiales bacterium]|nr:SprT family zinc-dependent metalloprotease [Acidimicrobiales bacterium]